MGKRFKLEYTDTDGSRKTPYIIHRAPLGTHERFIGFLIEHFAGAFPTWLSPLQVAIIPVRDTHSEHAQKIARALEGISTRVEIFGDNDSLGKRIHAAKKLNTPYIIVLGDKEASGSLTIETRKEKLEGVTIEAFIERLASEIKNRTLN